MCFLREHIGSDSHFERQRIFERLIWSQSSTRICRTPICQFLNCIFVGCIRISSKAVDTAARDMHAWKFLFFSLVLVSGIKRSYRCKKFCCCCIWLSLPQPPPSTVAPEGIANKEEISLLRSLFLSLSLSLSLSLHGNVYHFQFSPKSKRSTPPALVLHVSSSTASGSSGCLSGWVSSACCRARAARKSVLTLSMAAMAGNWLLQGRSGLEAKLGKGG